MLGRNLRLPAVVLAGVLAVPADVLAAAARPGEAVAYDPEHDGWLISTLGLDHSSGRTAVLTSRSTDGCAS